MKTQEQLNICKALKDFVDTVVTDEGIRNADIPLESKLAFYEALQELIRTCKRSMNFTAHRWLAWTAIPPTGEFEKQYGYTLAQKNGVLPVNNNTTALCVEVKVKENK